MAAPQSIQILDELNIYGYKVTSIGARYIFKDFDNQRIMRRVKKLGLDLNVTDIIFNSKLYSVSNFLIMIDKGELLENLEENGYISPSENLYSYTLLDINMLSLSQRFAISKYTTIKSYNDEFNINVEAEYKKKDIH